MGELTEILSRAGFTRIDVQNKANSDEIIRSWNFGGSVEKMVFSAYITAFKQKG